MTPDQRRKIMNPIKNWAGQIHYMYTNNSEFRFRVMQEFNRQHNGREGAKYWFLIKESGVIPTYAEFWNPDNTDLHSELIAEVKALTDGVDDDDVIRFVDEEIDIALPVGL